MVANSSVGYEFALFLANYTDSPDNPVSVTFVDSLEWDCGSLRPGEKVRVKDGTQFVVVGSMRV
jgi:hypothetical protein